MKDINNNLSVKAKIKTTPSAWSAPLTVTFDGRESIDPSKDTIPSNNFFWYYKDSSGIDILIGKGIVVKHTFETEGNYLVHMTARSANRDTEGILDGESTTAINVAPETANIIVYANSKKLLTKTYTKIGTFDAQKGVSIDWSPTQPKGWRQILSHHWEITGPSNFRFISEEYPTKPWSLTVKLPHNWAYTVNLIILDNEGNTTSKSFLLAVSDPIAIIKQTPEKISTSTIARFDGNASYALQSRIKQYNWELYDEEGEKLFASQSKDFSRQFTKPGSYTVKLKITDELGQSNEESLTVFVDSTPPQPQFTITSRLDRQYPSQFVLDASPSSDRDVATETDTITYDRSFSNNSQVTIDQSYDDNKTIVVSFNNPGTYIATLTVSDSYGKIVTLDKQIKVESSLRPIIYASPRASVRWQAIRFVVKSNDSIINYERDFWDGNKSIFSDNSAENTYKKTGVYTVKLLATNKRGEKNAISTQIFVWQKGYPVGAYSIYNGNQNIIKPTETCSGEVAFPAKRLEKIILDGTDSVNNKGEKNNLSLFFQPQYDEIFQTDRLQYQFKRLGCQYVDSVIEDTINSKIDKKRIRFYVTNDLPTLLSVSTTYPQFGNEIWVGITQNTKEKAFDPTSVNPLIVKVSAVGAKDNDGFVAQYVRYYYNKADPSRKLDIKTTPANNPSVFFSIYSEPGDIVFGVKMIDNDGAEQASEEIIGLGPSVFIAPKGDNSMDIPIINLSVDKTSVAVGEEVTFTTNAKILSGRPDFDAKKSISYDFDGDGIWDLTSKENSVTHIYKQGAENIRARVQVTYKWFPVQTESELISVKEELKPIVQYAVFDKTVIARDYSYGKIATRKICFEGRTECEGEISTGSYAVHTYPNYGKYVINLEIADSYGNIAKTREVIDLMAPDTNKVIFPLTLPQNTIKNNAYHINVGEQSNNQILMNLIYNGTGSCYLDKDINEDSNEDGQGANDHDLTCNTTVPMIYQPKTQTITARVIYDTILNGKSQLVSNDIVVNFIDQKINLTPDQDKLYKKIEALNNGLSDNNTNQKSLKALLKQLSQSIIIGQNPTDTILQIQEFIQKNTLGLTSGQSTSLEQILVEMSWADAIRAAGWSSYDASKAEIIQFVPAGLKPQVITIFDKIEALETPAAHPDEVKLYFSDLLKLLGANAVSSRELLNPWNEQKIDKADIETIIKPQICTILWYYEIASNECRPLDEGGSSALTSTIPKVSEWFWLNTIIKRVGIVVGWLLVIFLLIVSFFAIKAKLQSNHDEDEEEGHTPIQQ